MKQIVERAASKTGSGFIKAILVTRENQSGIRTRTGESSLAASVFGVLCILTLVNENRQPPRTRRISLWRVPSCDFVSFVVKVLKPRTTGIGKEVVNPTLSCII